jgi:hypothetical protein
MERDRVCERCQMRRPATAFERWRNTRRRACKSCLSLLDPIQLPPLQGDALAACPIVPFGLLADGRPYIDQYA